METTRSTPRGEGGMGVGGARVGGAVKLRCVERERGRRNDKEHQLPISGQE